MKSSRLLMAIALILFGLSSCDQPPQPDQDFSSVHALSKASIPVANINESEELSLDFEVYAPFFRKTYGLKDPSAISFRPSTASVFEDQFLTKALEVEVPIYWLTVRGNDNQDGKELFFKLWLNVEGENLVLPNNGQNYLQVSSCDGSVPCQLRFNEEKYIGCYPINEEGEANCKSVESQFGTEPAAFL